MSKTRAKDIQLFLLFTFHASLFTSRIDIEEGADDDQHQAFHEDKEAWHERAVFVVSVRPGDERSQRQTTRQPD